MDRSYFSRRSTLAKAKPTHARPLTPFYDTVTCPKRHRKHERKKRKNSGGTGNTRQRLCSLYAFTVRNKQCEERQVSQFSFFFADVCDGEWQRAPSFFLACCLSLSLPRTCFFFWCVNVLHIFVWTVHATALTTLFFRVYSLLRFSFFPPLPLLFNSTYNVHVTTHVCKPSSRVVRSSLKIILIKGVPVAA